jgi:putative ABC transport system ATP-binding protein
VALALHVAAAWRDFAITIVTHTHAMIETRALRYSYAQGPTLAYPDLSLPQGATLLLRGNSGCGKSTWLALAAGLLHAGAGQITVAGQDLARLGPVATDAWRARTIGFLPQKLHLSEALTVAGNLALAQWAAGVPDDPQAVARVLSALGLAGHGARKPSQLSGGQAQRVALARAVLLQPRVILADEPTASLDDDAAREVVQLLQTTAEHCQATLVLATHDARVALALPQALQCHLGVEAAPAMVPQP